MSKNVVDMLNEARARELEAISQYMVQHYELEDADFGKLAARLKEIGIQEMKHAEALAERILFLGGSPTSEPSGKPKKGLPVEDMLKIDIELEQGAVTMYNDFAKACGEAGDHISKQLFEQLLGEEEVHLSAFQNILNHIQKMGQAYLATLTG